MQNSLDVLKGLFWKEARKKVYIYGGTYYFLGNHQKVLFLLELKVAQMLQAFHFVNFSSSTSKKCVISSAGVLLPGSVRAVALSLS